MLQLPRQGQGSRRLAVCIHALARAVWHRREGAAATGHNEIVAFELQAEGGVILVDVHAGKQESQLRAFESQFLSKCLCVCVRARFCV